MRIFSVVAVLLVMAISTMLQLVITLAQAELPLYLPYISPLYLPYISPTSRLHDLELGVQQLHRGLRRLRLLRVVAQPARRLRERGAQLLLLLGAPLPGLRRGAHLAQRLAPRLLRFGLGLGS